MLSASLLAYAQLCSCTGSLAVSSTRCHHHHGNTMAPSWQHHIWKVWQCFLQPAAGIVWKLQFYSNLTLLSLVPKDLVEPERITKEQHSGKGKWKVNYSWWVSNINSGMNTTIRFLSKRETSVCPNSRISSVSILPPQNFLKGIRCVKYCQIYS